MVMFGARLSALFFCLGFSLSLARAQTWPDYKIGDIATNDIVTPVEFSVVDQEKTAALRAEEARRVQAIFRFCPETAGDVEHDFNAALDRLQRDFRSLVQSEFDRATLDVNAIATSQFIELVEKFRAQNDGFPLASKLAPLWALGESDESVRAPHLVALRDVMTHPIRSDELPNDIALGAQVRIAAVKHLDDTLALDELLAQSQVVSRTNLLSLSKARTTVRRVFWDKDRMLASYIASFVRVNCIFDVTLTREERARRLSPLVASHSYHTGDVVVKRGDVIDSNAKAALEQLREKLPPVEVAAPPQPEPALTQILRVVEPVQIPPIAAAPPSAPTHARAEAVVSAKNTFVAASSAAVAPPRTRSWRPVLWMGVCVFAAFLIWQIRRRNNVRRIAPSLISHAQLTNDQRLMLREKPELARAQLTPVLAKMMMSVFVQKLLGQRGDLIEVQKAAAAELAELERRLQELHAPMQERLRAYEKRIAELEQELARRGAENQELLKARIAVTRKQLEEIRVKGAPDWN